MENERLLSDEEMAKAAYRYNPTYKGGGFEYTCKPDADKEIAKAQDAKTNAEWIKWGEGACPHGMLDFPNDRGPVTMCYKIACGECWQERKRSVGL